MVCIEESGFFKLVHLSDGTILKTKVKLVLIGIVKLSLSYIHSSNAINKILFTKVELTNYYWFFYKSTSDIILMFTKDNFTLQQLCKILLKKIVIVNLLYIVLDNSWVWHVSKFFVPICGWKVLIGCDGVNSMVARWLGFKKPTFTGRSAIRGCTESIDSHGYGPKSMQFFESGVRFGCRPCDDKTLFWYITWVPSSQGKQYIPIWVVKYPLIVGSTKDPFGYNLFLLKTKNWKYYNKIIFKYVNSAVRPIFNEKWLRSKVCGTHEHCMGALFTGELVKSCS